MKEKILAILIMAFMVSSCSQNESIGKNDINLDTKPCLDLFDENKQYKSEDGYIFEFESVSEASIFALVKNYDVAENYEVLCHCNNGELICN